MDYSAIQAVDFALGYHLAQIFTPENVPLQGPKAFDRFLNNDIAKKIVRGAIFEPVAVLKAVEGSGGHLQTIRTGKVDIKMNQAVLPLVHYGRYPGLRSPSDPSRTDIQTHTVDLPSDKPAEVTIMYVELDYQLTVMAWDTPTLDSMIVALTMALKQKSNFDTVCSLEGERIEDVPCKILNAHEIAFTDSSAERDKKRLHAATTTLSIRAPLLAGKYVEVCDQIRVMLELGHRTDCEGGACGIL
ncbi:MAG: hypothetical protein OIF57_03305 [Marinobacterium sp.]|nr:hypothetical protein [Marinobacterium sp.]